MAKRALVTGACGFTGSNLVEHLLREKWEVVATDLKADAHGEYYCVDGDLHPMHYGSDLLEGMGVTYIPGDLTKKETLLPLFAKGSYDVVFHVASLYDYFAQWDVLYKVNVTGTRNIAELALENKVGRFVHWSTDGVYGEPKTLPGDENCPYDPPNLYSKSKVEQEKILWQMHKEKGFPITILRPAPIYGPRHRYGVYHILYGVEKIGLGAIISWFPKKHTLMFPSVHVLDLVRAASFVSDKPQAVGQAYNVLSDCIPQPEFMEFVYRSVGTEPIFHLPVWWPLYKLFTKVIRPFMVMQDKRARKQGTRPKIDIPMVDYITHQYWFSNQKIKDLGFKFIYQDPRKGLWEYIGWCKERGLL